MFYHSSFKRAQQIAEILFKYRPDLYLKFQQSTLTGGDAFLTSRLLSLEINDIHANTYAAETVAGFYAGIAGVAGKSEYLDGQIEEILREWAQMQPSPRRRSIEPLPPSLGIAVFPVKGNLLPPLSRGDEVESAAHQTDVVNHVEVADFEGKQNWRVKEQERPSAYGAAIHRYLLGEWKKGRPRRPTARDVITAFADAMPMEIAKILPDGFDYYDRLGDTKTANLEAIRKTIARMTPDVNPLWPDF